MIAVSPHEVECVIFAMGNNDIFLTGQCQACADKPRFGGPGTKKKACTQRYCRMRKLEEDHAQANYPLNSPDSLRYRLT